MKNKNMASSEEIIKAHREQARQMELRHSPAARFPLNKWTITLAIGLACLFIYGLHVEDTKHKAAQAIAGNDVFTCFDPAVNQTDTFKRSQIMREKTWGPWRYKVQAGPTTVIEVMSSAKCSISLADQNSIAR